MDNTSQSSFLSEPRLNTLSRSLLCIVLAMTAASMVSCRSWQAGSPRSSSKTKAVAQEKPSEADAQFAAAKGQALAQTGNFDAAIREFERAIAINPNLTHAYVGIGDIHRQQGDFASAEQSYAYAVKIEPRNFNAQYLHGLSLQILNRLSEAVRAYLRALSIRPNNADANLNLATAYLQLGEPDQGLTYAQFAVRHAPQRGDARINLGAIYAALGRHNDAIAEYQQAAELVELTPELLLNLSDSLSNAGRYAEMVVTLDQLITMQPSAIAYERLGSAHFRLRHYDDALTSFKQALTLDSQHYPALNGVGVCLLNRYIWSNKSDQKALKEAINALRRSIQIESRQPRIVELLSRYG